MPALAGSGQPAPRYEWWLRSLHVTQAWRSADGAGVTVALLSDGVAAGQRYLDGSVINGPDFTRSGRGSGSRYYGVTGTSLASLIIGHGQAGTKAVDGVAPRAKVLSVRVTLSPGDPLWSDSRITSRLPAAIATGIRYAVRHGATVIDLPADPGVRYPAIASGSLAAAGGSPEESAAVQYAESRNVLLVAPAGDNGRTGNNVNYPAAYPGIIAVGAFGPGFVKAPYSSRQPYVTLTAAGQNVATASPSGFRTLNSTAAASAIVAGIAALIRSEFPNLAASRVRSSMINSTVFGRKGGIAIGSGFGTVDAARAVTAAATMSPPHARPAMQGAVPRSRPVAPMIRSSGSIIARDLTGDAGLSLAALALLLIPIILYGTMARRRERTQMLLAAEHSHHAMSRPGHGTMLADPLLEFFGPQHARPADPASTRPIPTPRFQPRPGLTGRSTMSASLAARSPLPPAPARNAQGQVTQRHTPATLPAPTAQLGSGKSPGRQGPDSTVRRVQVNGQPPWEPAQEPTSDLPWVIAPPQAPVKTGGIDAPPIAPPPDSVWDSPPARRSSAPRSLFEPAAPPPQPAGDPGGSPPWASPEGGSPHRANTAGASGGSPHRANTAGASGGSPHRANTAGGSGGSPHRANTALPQRRAADSGQASTGQQHPSQPGQPTSWRDLAALGDRPGADSDRGPIFRWSPTGSTDQFAAVDPGPDGPGRRDRH